MTAMVTVLTLATAGLSAATSQSPMTTERITLQPVPYAELPGWKRDDHLAAFKAFRRSCAEVISSADAGRAALAAVCRTATTLNKPTRASARAFFEQHFVPHRVMRDNGHGFLTGYYEPVLNGSRKAEGRFQTPIYRRPPDLVNVVAETDRASQASGLTHLRKTAKGTEPYPTRAEIEQGALKGKSLELLYLEDPVDAFFMHVQGSGRIKLRDGTSVRLNYDGKNGHPYSSVGRYLVDEGYFKADEVTLQTLRKWLRADPERGRKAMWQNASFIFFRELDGSDAEGPLGAMSVPLTPGRSLAVDPAFHALGAPIYVSAPALKSVTKDASAFRRLMIAQDVGSAIKGPERGDIYYGSGDKAGRLAGITRHEGSFFVLVASPAQEADNAGKLQRASWQRKAKTAGR